MVQFDHEKLDVYQAALELVTWVERLLDGMESTIAARDHLRRASESIVRNIVRANSKRSPPDRAHTFDVSYGSALECAACLDVLCAWDILEGADTMQGKGQLDRIVAMLIGLRFAKVSQVRESRGEYTVNLKSTAEPLFSHEQLRVYQSALRFVHWTAELIGPGDLGFPKGRDLDRHSTAIALNIAEGNGKFSPEDRKRFLHIAINSGLQAASSLDIMTARSVLAPEVTQQGKEHLGEVISMIGSLARSL